MGVGMPAALKLQQFGSLVEDAFGECAYLVGSAATLKTGWRDVDVRVLLDDAEYERLGLGDPNYPSHNAKSVALTLAFAALGREMTGLPIDFQIQQRTKANAENKGQRDALGMVPHRFAVPPTEPCPKCGNVGGKHLEKREKRADGTTLHSSVWCCPWCTPEAP